MLIKCPECDLQISDKAITCPHCGYPIKNISKSQFRKSNKHKRLPNGFGQITLIKNKNLRNPYRAMVTTGKNSEGRPIQKLLKPQAYFKTYNEAYEALVEYNKNPYDLDNDILMFQLYDKWTSYYFPTLKSDSSIRTVKSAWSYCSEIYDMRVKDVRARHIKGCIEEGMCDGKHTTPNIKGRIKSMFNMMLDYALEYELVDRNYARIFNLSGEVIKDIKDAQRSHIPFTDDEIQKLWKNRKIPYVDAVIIQCYMGWRPQELGLLELSNVNLKDKYIIGGMKTEAGINRRVPIHPLIFPLIEKYKQEAESIGSKYLINCTDSVTHTNSIALSYERYQQRFSKIVDALKLNPEHRPHDPRKHFVTLCKKYKVDEYAIKYMVGHHISDITESVYTERDPKWLNEEIEKIK